MLFILRTRQNHIHFHFENDIINVEIGLHRVNKNIFISKIKVTFKLKSTGALTFELKQNLFRNFYYSLKKNSKTTKKTKVKVYCNITKLKPNTLLYYMLYDCNCWGNVQYPMIWFIHLYPFGTFIEAICLC